VVDGKVLQPLARGAGRVGEELWGRTEKAVAGSDNVSKGGERIGRNAHTVFSCSSREGLTVSYEADERLPPSCLGKLNVTSVRMIAGPKSDVSSSRAILERCGMGCSRR